MKWTEVDNMKVKQEVLVCVSLQLHSLTVHVPGRRVPAHSPNSPFSCEFTRGAALPSLNVEQRKPKSEHQAQKSSKSIAVNP